MASYIVSLVYHRIDDDFTGTPDYEILDQEYIDLRSVFPIDDIQEDVNCYYQDWINNVNDGVEVFYDNVYHLVISVTTEYSKDYWGEVHGDMDYELISHKMDGHTVDEYIEYTDIKTEPNGSGAAAIIFQRVLRRKERI
jgi:hypothetical protein